MRDLHAKFAHLLDQIYWTSFISPRTVRFVWSRTVRQAPMPTFQRLPSHEWIPGNLEFLGRHFGAVLAGFWNKDDPKTEGVWERSSNLLYIHAAHLLMYVPNSWTSQQAYLQDTSLIASLTICLHLFGYQ